VTGGSGAASVDWLNRRWREVPWVVVDVEGNGQRPPDLVEAACLPVDDGRPGTGRSWLVRPPRPITGMVTRIHGIHNTDVADAPAVAQVAAEIRVALAGRVVVGHHVGVDLAVLHRELDGWTPPAVLDTLRLAKQIWPGLPSYRLDALTQRIGHTTPPAAAGRRHRAGHDAALTAGLFLAIAATIDTVAGGQFTARQLLAPADPVSAGSSSVGTVEPDDRMF
jgi:exodeoxyribonuclease X